ncbi:MAG: tRNA pseudouridine(55) synthase TruB [Candidatus Nomurabacteria bacterium]|nr:tRNA pseudouridine(55) synthase TruB [Candidatus Nomurabacteria bacterium]
MNPDRIILIDKPAGISSFGAVNRVRKFLTIQKRAAETAAGISIPNQTKRVKVGHTGTLDPFATGLLILLSGKMTRRASEFSHLDKIYQAEIRLGQTSTTGDPEGEITPRPVREIPSRAQIEKILPKFTGRIQQIPPIYSAIKIGGRRAYQLARAGEKPAMPTRTVEIYALEILDYGWPILKIRAHVSSGTYIRTLAEDIGAALGVGAFTKNLRRLKVGNFDVKDARPLSDFDLNPANG